MSLLGSFMQLILLFLHPLPVNSSKGVTLKLSFRHQI
jgi:hypothetical protein